MKNRRLPAGHSAMISLGQMYQKGLGVSKDHTEAKWYEIAAAGRWGRVG
jgi:TPR repeat protein